MQASFWNWWQQLPAHMDPTIIAIGWFRPQYYGLMYLVAFGLVYFLVQYRLKRESRFDISVDQVRDLTTAMMMGVIVGGRLGYVLFYNPVYYWHHPLEIVLPFSFSNGLTFTGLAGMSYHGGLVAVVLAIWLYVRKAGLNLWQTVDLYAPVIPLGYTFGRVGNFINGELFGRVTTAPIGMFFPLAPSAHLRHPSQLYEAFGEGILLFGVLWYLRRWKMPPGAMLGFYLIGYGTVRFIIEFFRQPDAHMGFILMSFSMGQILCAIMVTSGAILLGYLWRVPLPAAARGSKSGRSKKQRARK
jgi:phosphatidylglycerol---prolipoprotein diacylglyceryl transferase